MKMLTEQEKYALKIAHSIEYDYQIDAIESAVLAKLKAQEPVAWMNAKRDMTFIYGPYNADDIPLYLHPDPRVAELEAVLRECRDHLNDIAIHIIGAEYETPLLQASEAIAKIDEVLK